MIGCFWPGRVGGDEGRVTIILFEGTLGLNLPVNNKARSARTSRFTFYVLSKPGRFLEILVYDPWPTGRGTVLEGKPPGPGQLG